MIPLRFLLNILCIFSPLDFSTIPVAPTLMLAQNAPIIKTVFFKNKYQKVKLFVGILLLIRKHELYFRGITVPWILGLSADTKMASVIHRFLKAFLLFLEFRHLYLPKVFFDLFNLRKIKWKELLRIVGIQINVTLQTLKNFCIRQWLFCVSTQA